MSTSLRNLIATAFSWLFLVACIGGSVVYHTEMKALAIAVLGLPTPESLAATGEPRRQAQPSTAANTEKPANSGIGGRTVELRAGSSGHFNTHANINGSSIDVLVDTGATIVALTWADAQRAGIFVRPSDFTGRVNTANGSARVAPVTIDRISIGDITVYNVRGVVSEDGNLSTTLLGMSFLGKLSRAEMRRGTLLLEE